MTEKQIKKELNHFSHLPYPLQYWCFEDFIKENINQADYFIALIEGYQEKALDKRRKI